MKKYITNLYGHGQESTAMNAQQMIAKLAEDMGYSEIGVRGHNVNKDTESEREKRIEGLLSSVSENSLIVAQMPSWCGIAFDEIFLEKLKQRSENLVIFVHDFVPLMFVNNRYLMKRYLKAYNSADVVILPSEKMAEILRKEGLHAPVMIQEVWDHVSSIEDIGRSTFEKRLKFAGNITRFPFVKNWDGALPLEVFSHSLPSERPNLTFRGWMQGDGLLRELNQGGFGLVWSENIDNQDEREYSEMNASFKFSTYLAAGLPLFVNQGIAKQAFVEKYGIGFVVESLDEAVSIIEQMTKEEYEEIQGRVHKISELLREGFFTKKMLIEVQDFLYLGEQNDNL